MLSFNGGLLCLAVLLCANFHRGSNGDLNVFRKPCRESFRSTFVVVVVDYFGSARQLSGSRVSGETSKLKSFSPSDEWQSRRWEQRQPREVRRLCPASGERWSRVCWETVSEESLKGRRRFPWRVCCSTSAAWTTKLKEPVSERRRWFHNKPTAPWSKADIQSNLKGSKWFEITKKRKKGKKKRSGLKPAGVSSKGGMGRH